MVEYVKRASVIMDGITCNLSWIKGGYSVRPFIYPSFPQIKIIRRKAVRFKILDLL